MTQTLKLGSIDVDVVKRDIKNVHLSVYPPAGRVKISAPMRMNLETIRVFAISKLAWIREQQQKIRAQERETPRAYIERESHYLWGRRYLLEVTETDAAPRIEHRHKTLFMQVRPGSGEEARRELLDAWYRAELKAAAAPLIKRWEPVIGVSVERLFVRRMRTKWGSCSRTQNAIRLNTDLAKKPRECLEYVVVHEMAHLIEPTHNSRFISLMDKFMPNWQQFRNQLNELPVRHEEWKAVAASAS